MTLNLITDIYIIMDTPEQIAEQFLDLWAAELTLLVQDPLAMQQFLLSVAAKMGGQGLA